MQKTISLNNYSNSIRNIAFSTSGSKFILFFAANLQYDLAKRRKNKVNFE
jgi:hypothetical protein